MLNSEYSKDKWGLRANEQSERLSGQKTAKRRDIKNRGSLAKLT